MKMTNEHARLRYLLISLIVVTAALIVGDRIIADTPRLLIADGVSLFAVLYVLTQGVERVNEFTVAILAYVPKSAEDNKRRELAKKDKDQGTIDQARSDLTVLTQGISFAVSYVVVSYFNYGVLAAISVPEQNDVSPRFDRVVTALIVAGGSKGLHDLISKIQKSKEADEA